MGLSPASGSVLTALSLEPASDSVSSSLSLCAPPLIAVCFSLPKIINVSPKSLFFNVYLFLRHRERERQRERERERERQSNRGRGAELGET